ncbi:putative RING-H2 finger protein [Halocaridina rubra]|uniref:RING-H2 finger protein n=1 Tax=Halocaridina rubra TaxID=373956 RepID=A0AAN8X868_HALRR
MYNRVFLCKAKVQRPSCFGGSNHTDTDIEEEFVSHLKVLVPRLLSPENLVKKEIGGQPIKARDLLKFFTLFMEVFKDNDLPEPTTLVEFAAQASSQAALEAGKEAYVEIMEALVGGDRPFLKTVQMEVEHNKAREKAVKTYLEKNKYGRKNQSVVQRYQDSLSEEIDKMYLKYSQQNEAKNVFKAARTPATLFCILMFFYLMSGIFGLLGMYSFASMCNLGMGVFLLMLTAWAYVSFMVTWKIHSLHGFVGNFFLWVVHQGLHSTFQSSVSLFEAFQLHNGDLSRSPSQFKVSHVDSD